jgi:UDP-N-acetyl-D-mannosaminuronic acid transferase (WecB/TagA/CpsF family)
MRMKTDNIIKIDCTTITTYRNTKTGETSSEKIEGPDIVQDVTVQVTNKGLEVFQKVMNKDNDKNNK